MSSEDEQPSQAEEQAQAEETKAEETRRQLWGFEENPVVFIASAALIIAFVIFGVVYSTFAAELFEEIQEALTLWIGWWYILAVSGFLVFVVWMAFSRFAHLKLGGDDQEPEFSTLAWFAMLFSAGMAIGLIFWSVAEPLSHFHDPPVGEGGDEQAALTAMRYTYFHWGLHAWAIYAVVGLTMGYAAFRKGLPLSIRSVFHPLIGDRIYGWFGHIVDAFAVIATLFGLATSLAMGVLQVNSGLSALGVVDVSPLVQVVLVVVITAFAMISIALGLSRGIRRLSMINLFLSAVLVTFVLITGPTVFVLDSITQNVGEYVQNLPRASFWTDAFGGTEWQANWTTFFWGTWIAWAPYVGIFIARISKGRTIREFVLGVLLAPTLVGIVWMGIFGNTAIAFEMFGDTNLGAFVEEEETVPLALFGMLAELPLTQLASGLAVIVVIVYFVTSSDSGSLVVDLLSSNGMVHPPTRQRMFWAALEGAVAATLVVAGGLTALRTAATTTAAPFSIILAFMCWALVRGLKRDVPKRETLREPPRPGEDSPREAPAAQRQSG